MAEFVSDSKLREIWDRLVLLLIMRPRAGWEHQFDDIVRREIERLAVLAEVGECHGK